MGLSWEILDGMSYLLALDLNLEMTHLAPTTGYLYLFL